MIQKVNLADAFARFDDHWHPRIAAELNDAYLKLVKVQGEFVWHHHAAEDDLFLVVKGTLVVKLRDGEVRLGPGELAVVPRGVEHLPVAAAEVHLLLLEPKTTVNTGSASGDRTAPDEWI